MANSVARANQPTTTADPVALEQLKRDLLHAFHVVDLEGQPSGMGSHLTARLPGADTFWFHPHSYGFNEVTGDMLHEADFELNVLDGNVNINPTLHIHTRIYLARPDVTCILHTHAKHCLALSIIGQDMVPVSLSGALLHDDCPTYDESATVALDRSEGEAMAEALGGRRALILKNHGLLSVGTTIRDAVLTGIIMEREAETILLARSAGTIQPMPEQGCIETKAFLTSDKMQSQLWTYFCRNAARQRPEELGPFID